MASNWALVQGRPGNDFVVLGPDNFIVILEQNYCSSGLNYNAQKYAGSWQRP
jgi:hypothetical protein